MLDAFSKAVFHTLAGSRTLKRLASRYGMRGRTGFARRFIAGETLDEAIVAARAIEAAGMSLTLDYLGESVSTVEEAETATRAYTDMVGRIAAAGITRNISLKLTQLGLDIDRRICLDNLRRILQRAQSEEFFVRIDMENSPYTDATLEIFEAVWNEGHRGVGVVLQSCLYRSERDLARVNGMGARVRLVKGAYKEPKEIAYQNKADVDAAYIRIMQTLLGEGVFPAIATHDPAIIDATRRWAADRGIPRDRFEFQMLYGIRRDLQSALVADGLGMRVYVPFGCEWFPYFMRRLGERPANLQFVLRSLFQER
jgi:proline dehydrogenase